MNLDEFEAWEDRGPNGRGCLVMVLSVLALALAALVIWAAV